MSASADLQHLGPESDRRRATLGEAVKAALETYFNTLDGQRPDELHRMVIEEVERPLLECVMFHCGGNQTKASQYLGLNRGTLRKKLRYYGID